jgi:hypothetical protein
MVIHKISSLNLEPTVPLSFEEETHHHPFRAVPRAYEYHGNYYVAPQFPKLLSSL